MRDPFDYLLYPSPGSQFSDVAAWVIERRKSDKRLQGFVFNGRILLVGSDDTRESLHDEYWKECAK